MKGAAQSRYHSTVGKQFRIEAERLAPRVAGLADFDPLERADVLVEAFLGDSDPRLRALVVSEVSRIAWTKRDAALLEIDRQARAVLESLPDLVRDQVGFASKIAKLEALLAPHLPVASESRRAHLVNAVARIESEIHGELREARYATAARLLLSRGETRAAVSRSLGISTNVIERIAREHVSDVTIDHNDPIVTTLVPGLYR